MSAATRPTHIILPRYREPWGSYLRELWRYRELLVVLTWRDLKLRYKQTALGVAWVVLQPVSSIVVFSLLFGRLARLPSDGVPYPIFALIGFLPWSYFATNVGRGTLSLLNHRELVNKVYFPRLLLPAGVVFAGMMDYLLGGCLLAGMLVYYGITPSALSLITVPALTLVMISLALGFNMLFGAMAVRYRDVTHVLPFFMQLWMFATPVVYPVSMIPRHWRWIAGLNPLSGIIEGLRAAILGRPCDLHTLEVSLFMSIFFLCFGAYYFKLVERTFADVI
jgi:lipopolysaccharide transport system permease protein